MRPRYGINETSVLFFFFCVLLYIFFYPIQFQTNSQTLNQFVMVRLWLVVWPFANWYRYVSNNVTSILCTVVWIVSKRWMDGWIESYVSREQYSLVRLYVRFEYDGVTHSELLSWFFKFIFWMRDEMVDKFWKFLQVIHRIKKLIILIFSHWKQ